MRRTAWLTFGLVALTGCTSDAPAPGTGVAIDTVGGVPRITNSDSGTWAEGDAWSVGEPVLTVGTLDGRPETVFGRVTGLTLSPDGRLYVADVQASEIRVFDRTDGAHLLTFGREGEGPGEFRYVDGVALAPGGRVYVRDAQAMSVSAFESDGTFLTSFQLRRPYFQLGNGDGFWVDDEGRIYDRTALGRARGADSLGVMVYAADGRPLDTIPAVTWTTPKAEVTRDGRLEATMDVPYHPVGQVAVGPDGHVAAALGDQYEVRVLDPAGDLRRLVRRDVPPTPLSGVDRDSAAARTERRVDFLLEATEGGELSEWSLPSHIPFVSELRFDSEGHLWVGRDGFGGEPSAIYDVFRPDGRFLGTVEIPLEGFGLRQIGADFLLGTRTDELDVTRVVVLPLRR